MYKFGSVQDVISLQEFVKEYDSGTTKVANTKAAKFAAELEKTAYTINKVLPAASKASRSLFKLSPTSMGRMGNGALAGALTGGAWGALSPDTPTNIFGQRQAPTFGDRMRSAAGNAFAFGTVGALGGLYSPKIKRFLTKPRVGGTPHTPTTPKAPVDTPKVPVDTPKAPPATPEAPPRGATHQYYDIPDATSAASQAPQGGPSVNVVSRAQRTEPRATSPGTPPGTPRTSAQFTQIPGTTVHPGHTPAATTSQAPLQTSGQFPHVATHDIPPSTSAAGGTVSQAPTQVSPIKAMFQERARGAQVAPNTSGAPRPRPVDPRTGLPGWVAPLGVPLGVAALTAASGMMPD